MADFETKLRWLSEVGDPVGAEELIERIEAGLAGDPLVVVSKRREGTTMTKTRPSPTDSKPSRNRGPLWAAAAFVAVLAVAGIYYGLSGDPEQNEVADTQPAQTTVAPPPTSAAPTETIAASEAQIEANLEVIQAGVAAFYSGDAQRAVELFELPDRPDDEIRAEAAYQAAIGGRLSPNCSGGEGGVFSCRVPYHNALTAAVGYQDSGDVNRVVVEDGVITEFAFPEHSWINLQFGTFLAMEGRFDGYGPCGFGPFPESCAMIQLENVDGWVEWRKTGVDPARLAEVTLEAWYGRDCEQATFLSGTDIAGDGGSDLCPSAPDQPTTSPIRIMDYEYILGADVSVEACEAISSTTVSCEVHYSNKLNLSVGKPPVVITREFNVLYDALLGAGTEDVWYRDDYPEDTELRESFQAFAESGDLRTEYEAAGCAINRTEVCAQLIEDNLEPWAAWYQINS